MKKKIIAGNWKMNHSLKEAEAFIKYLGDNLSKFGQLEKLDILLAPSYVFLHKALELSNRSSIKISAQNLHEEEKGAFTGEVSAQMLSSIGINYVILGHSERRTYFFENDTIILKKIKQALKWKIKPILCVGETLEEREEGKHLEKIYSQLNATLFKLSEHEMNSVILAYEPIWAIGTGKSATKQEAQDMHYYIRETIKKENTLCDPYILYGGSVNLSNAKEILNQKDIDGGLIGGASLNVEDFIKIISMLS